MLTLLPTYIDLLDPSGVEIGLFVTALGVARFVGIVPLGWAGDRYDKRTLLVGSLLLSIAAFLLFPFVDSALGFIAARVLQGFGALGVGMLGLALVGDLAGGGERANRIGKYNAARMAAGVGGTLGAGALYDLYGFGPIFGLLAGLLAVATVGVVLFIGPDETTVEGFAFTDLALNRRILTMSSSSPAGVPTGSSHSRSRSQRSSATGSDCVPFPFRCSGRSPSHCRSSWR